MKQTFIITYIAVALFSFGFKQNKAYYDVPISNKDSTIENALEGIYSLTVNIYKDNPEFVGNLYLIERYYGFEFKRSYIDLSETNIPDFIFLKFQDGKYTVNYNIDESTKLSELDDHQIIGNISFSGNSNSNEDNTLVKDLLLRLDKERQVLYFHSLISEFQTWNLEKYIGTENNFNNSSEIPDTLQLLIKINNVLPIGWGTKYSSNILEVKKGYLDSNQNTINFSVSVGSEHLLKNIHLLKPETELIVIFVNSGRTTDKPYTPAGTTGFINEKGEIWNIISIEN